MTPNVEIVHRDEHLLVLWKPSGLPTTSPDDGPCLVNVAKELDPDAERMHPSSRLDAEVTGLVTFARTSRAIDVLKTARERGTYKRLYLGLVEREPNPPSGDWRAAIAIDPKDPRRRVVATGPASPHVKNAHTRYSVRARAAHGVLLNLWPQTGRTHQLRVHTAHAGISLIGDVHYGGKKHITTPDGRVHLARRTMLHCFELELPGVAAREPLKLRARMPRDFETLWVSLGGAADVFA